MHLVENGDNWENALPALRVPPQTRTSVRATRLRRHQRVARFLRAHGDAALPLACAVFAVAAAATLTVPLRASGVSVDGAVVTSVAPGSEGWIVGVRPGWYAIAIGTGTAMYSDGESTRVVMDDAARFDPMRALAPAAFALLAAGLAWLLRLRRLSTTAALGAAVLALPIADGRLGLAGGAVIFVPPALAGVFAWRTEGAAAARIGPGPRLAAYVALPAAALAGGFAAGGPLLGAGAAVAGYVAIALVFAYAARWAVVRARVGSAAGTLAVLRATTLDLLPFAERMRRTGALAERDRLASDLHAEVLPAIASTAADLERRGDGEAAARLRTLAAEVRDLMSARRLPILEDDGLVAAAEWLAESLESRSEIRLEIDLAGDSGSRAPAAIERSAYRVLQLALDNVIRHAGASIATVAIAGSPRSLVLTVSDDGRGIAEEDATRALRRGHLGLVDMRTEADAVGAALTVEPDSPRGTVVAFRWRA